MTSKEISKVADRNVAAAMRCAKILLPKAGACDHTSLASRILRLAHAYRLLDRIR